MSQKQRELDLILYRLETLEKRIDNIERAMLTQKSENINTELLNVVLSMVRPQAHQHHTETPVGVISASQQIQHQADTVPGSSFMFNRRKTVV